MADLQFDEGQEYARPDLQPSFLTRLILQTGLVETERDTQYVLLIVAVLCLIAAMYVAFSSVSNSAVPQSPYKVGQNALLPVALP